MGERAHLNLLLTPDMMEDVVAMSELTGWSRNKVVRHILHFYFVSPAPHDQEIAEAIEYRKFQTDQTCHTHPGMA